MPRITFITDNLTVDAALGEPLIDVCLRANASVPFSCQEGTCGTCISTIKRGGEKLDAPSEQERSTLALYGGTEQHRLVCQCKTRGDLDIDQP